MHRVPGLDLIALSQPRECIADGIDRGAYGLRLCLKDIDQEKLFPSYVPKTTE
jgi:hypothetical protein